ncbi:MAG: hypothetical protein WC554_09140 [Clostridia bacterium]
MIKFKNSPKDLKAKHPIFNSITFAIIANEIQTPPSNAFTNKKLDLDKFYSYLKTKGFKAAFKEMKELIIEAAPILGITAYIKLSNEEKKNLLFVEKYVYGKETSIDEFTEAEILKNSQLLSTDYVVRSMYGDSDEAYYRIGRQMNDHDRNLLKAAYSIKYGDPLKTPWKNYLDARPASIGHIEKFGKSFDHTANMVTDFKGKVYN